MSYADEIYKRITGVEPPKPWDQRTPEERRHALDLFFEAVNASTEDDDAAVDEFFKNIKMNPQLQVPDFSDMEEESA